MYSKIISAAVLSAVLAAPAMAGTTHPVTNTVHSTHGATVHSTHSATVHSTHAATISHGGAALTTKSH